MRVKSLLVIAATVAFSACAEKISSPLQEEIGFKAVAYRATKAEVYGPIGSNYADGEHFGVYAYHKDANNAWVTEEYMDNVEISKDGDVWRNSSKRYYWPRQGNLTFICYSPYQFDGTVEVSRENGLSIANFIASTDTAKQVDLMDADPICNMTNQSTPVGVTFKHILSRIEFKFKSQEDYSSSNITAIAVDGLVVHNVLTKANYQEQYSGSPIAVTRSWGGHQEPKNYTLIDDNVAAVAVAIDGATVASLKKPILVIPQNLNDVKWQQGSEEFDAVELSYTITFENGSQSSTTAYFSTKQEWKVGKKYIYTVAIGLNEITFTPEVEDWDTTIDTTIDI